jgi:hypothetical protein
MPGLDPSIHTDCRRSPNFIMDRRIKSGDDGITSRAYPTLSCPALCRASTPFFTAKTWMAGTSPAMTLLFSVKKISLSHCPTRFGNPYGVAYFKTLGIDYRLSQLSLAAIDHPGGPMKVEVDVYQDEVEGDHGRPVDGLCLTCERCGHQVKVFGTSNASAQRGAVVLREECPQGENNYYEVDWN